jgi:hypothetical protein
MRTTAAMVLDWLHQLALSVWLGGAVVLGAVSAPAVFGTAKRAGDTEWGMPLYNFAGTALGEAFRRFNYLVLAAGAVMLLAGLLSGVLAGQGPRRLGARALLTGAAWCAAAWLTWGLYPQLLAARAAGRMDLFDTLHRTYTTGFTVQMVLLLSAAALTAWLHLDRGARPAPEETRSPARRAAPAA